MECKHCRSKKYRKNGYAGGFQRYNCKDCKRNWTLQKSKGYGIEIRLQALKLYLEGLGFRSIGRILNVSNVTVLKWIKSMGEKLFQEGALWKNTDIKAVPQIQIDEFWHYIQKNNVRFGFGLLYVQKQIAIFCGNRTKRSAKFIWKLIKKLQPKCIFTDNLASYRGVFPKNKHVIGKKHTQMIESINATFRHYLCRFRRRTTQSLRL